MAFQFALVLWWAAALPPLMVSIAYLYASPPSVPPAQRVAVSVHGAAIALLFLGAMLFGAFGGPKQEYGEIYSLLLLLPIESIVYSLMRFTGKKWIHILQAINLIWLIMTFFVGGMAVTNAWI